MGKVFKTWPAKQLHAAEEGFRWTSGWQWSCPDNSPLRRTTIDVVLNDEQVEGHISSVGRKEFVADYDMAMDVCYNPELRNLVSPSPRSWLTS